MDAYPLFLSVLFVYIAFLILTGLYFARRQASSVDFWLAGRKAGALSIGFSAAASWLTAGALLAVTGFFMLLGMGSVWGFVAPNILALLIIAFFVRKIQALPAMTQPELLEMRYGPYLRLPVALIITVVMILFAVSDIKGFAMVLEVFYGISQMHAALIVGLAVAAYVTLGGLSAVIATDVVQFLCLALFVLVMAGMVVACAGTEAGGHLTLGQVLAGAPEGWWNPVSIGLPMVLIFVLAIVPGWITEQDPWQRVWAARDGKAAQRGMLLGSLLVALVFGGCAVIALGLNLIYPDIAKAGFPVGMGKAEPALLNFIMDRHFSNFSLALCAVALATAAMSCTDTFAASGASCVARDIFGRYVDGNPRRMQRVNRISVLAIVFLATAGSFFINSIIDAIHIATFIASASYFFVLMGGLYWPRATGKGALASMWTGFLVQTGLVIFDLAKTAPSAPPFLESLHPALMGHGVIVAMLISGGVFVIVSLMTAPSTSQQLAPFFPAGTARS